MPTRTGFEIEKDYDDVDWVRATILENTREKVTVLEVLEPKSERADFEHVTPDKKLVLAAVNRWTGSEEAKKKKKKTGQKKKKSAHSRRKHWSMRWASRRLK